MPFKTKNKVKTATLQSWTRSEPVLRQKIGSIAEGTVAGDKIK